MSALNETLTEREVQHEWDLHARQWEAEHMDDDDVQNLRAETSCMGRTPRTLDEAMRQHYTTLREYSARSLAEWWDDDCDQEEER